MSTPSVIGNPQGGNDLAEVMKESVSKQDAATLAAAAKRLSDRASALQNDQSSPDNALIARVLREVVSGLTNTPLPAKK